MKESIYIKGLQTLEVGKLVAHKVFELILVNGKQLGGNIHR